MSATEGIRETIRRFRYTQMELAAMAGVSQPAIYNFLRGGWIRAASLDRLCEGMGLTLALVPIPRREEQPKEGMQEDEG